MSNQVAVRDFEQIAYKAVDNGAKEFSLVSRRVSLCPADHIKKFIVRDSLKKKIWEITRLVSNYLKIFKFILGTEGEGN